MAPASEPVSDATETFRVMKKRKSPTGTAAIKTFGARTTVTPRAVATPLPPRKPIYGEVMCPRKAANPAAQATSSEMDLRARKAGKAPLKTSSIMVRIPARGPAVLVTLVAPMFPLPTFRTSIPLDMEAIMYPKGMLPMK